MVSKGYFVVADISGYTAFLTQSELDHAEVVLDILIKAQIELLYDPFVVNSFRGDGILAYVLDNSGTYGLEFLHRLDEVYYNFTIQRETMYRNSTCPCQACRNIPTLDLKFFVHHGNFMLQKMGDREEMLGPDVIVVHRMMKNNVKEQTGVGAYTLLTDTALDALGLENLRSKLIPYQDEYEHIGKINMYVYDLMQEYNNQRERRRIEVTSDTAQLTLEVTLPVTPMTAWKFLMDPSQRKEFLHIESHFPRQEYVNHIHIHGWSLNSPIYKSVIDALVDWQAGHFLTTEGVGYDESRYRTTYLIEPVGEGSRLSLLLRVISDHPDKVLSKYKAGLSETLDSIRVAVGASTAEVG
ncbi:MAG: DUF2652 domain-containing protein [Ignavibacteria bacterium]|nr:DUF2652 domain-containing protein [Ignavibacteria bacterium]